MKPGRASTRMPTWRDAGGRRVPTHPCSVCGRDAPVMRYPVGVLRQLGREIGRRTTVINWCGHENGYVPHAESVGAALSAQTPSTTSTFETAVRRRAGRAAWYSGELYQRLA